MAPLTELSLFSGAGGGLLASKHLLGHRIVGYVEHDAYCVKILQARIADRLLDDAPIWDDARTFDGKPWRGRVDLVSAGFPCQPFSVAGKRRGADDERNMWPDTIRIVREVRPRLVFLENVPGLLAGHGYFGTVLGDLAAAGFDAEWCVLSAADVGANHLRKRLWILAYAHGESARQLHLRRRGQDEAAAHADGDGEDVPDAEGAGGPAESEPGVRQCEIDADGNGLQGAMADSGSSGLEIRQAEGFQGCVRATERSDWWASEPPLGRVVDGFSGRVGQLRALGNAQVPLVAARAFRLLMERLA